MKKIIYPYVPKGREILYVPESNEFMKEAKRICKEDSTDLYHPTGAVLVKDGKVLVGAGNRSRIKNQKLIQFHREVFCIRRIFKIKTGRKYWLCYGCSSSRLHAESRVVDSAVSKGIDISGADVYLWGHWWCCKPCWENMANGGVRNVYLLENSEFLFNRSRPENSIGRFTE